MKVKVTIEYLEPHPDGFELDPVVFQFDRMHISQERPVERILDPEGGVSQLIPGPETTTVITGVLES